MYESFSDERLRELAARPQDLTDEARLALAAEVERRGLFAPDVDPPLAEGATPCADHPQRAVVGTCRRCGRFICYRCDGDVGGRLQSLPETPPQGLCRACRALAEAAPPARAIGGWLALLGIGLVVAPLQDLRLVYASIQFFRTTQLSTLGQTLVVADTLLGMAALAVTLWAAVRFFSKKTDAPNWLIGVFVASVVQPMLEVGFEHLLAKEVVWGGGSNKAELVSAVVRAALWIPYLKLSQRVKETFVVR